MSRPKPVNISLISRNDNVYGDLYTLLARVVGKWHPHLKDVSVALFWRTNWKPHPKTGQIVFGKAKKLSDFEREYTSDDAAILLNSEVWPELTAEQQEALLDHELSHLGTTTEDGDLKRDDRGRVVVHTIPHDFADFLDVIRRHGLYLDDLRRTAQAILDSKDAPLLATLQDESEEANHPKVFVG